MSMSSGGAPESGIRVYPSFDRADFEAGIELCEALDGAGIPRFVPQNADGPGRAEEVRQALNNSDLLLVPGFSNASTQPGSRSVRNEELAHGIEARRMRRPDDTWLIPVRFDDCRIPDLHLGGNQYLGNLYPVDLFGPRKEANTARLVTGLGRIVGQSQGGTGNQRQPEPPPRADAYEQRRVVPATPDDLTQAERLQATLDKMRDDETSNSELIRQRRIAAQQLADAEALAAQQLQQQRRAAWDAAHPPQLAQSDRADVFISYAPGDESRMGQIRDGLEEVGFTTWTADRDLMAGGVGRDRVSKVIGESAVSLILFSGNRDTQNGRHNEELLWAIDKQRNSRPGAQPGLIPAVIDAQGRIPGMNIGGGKLLTHLPNVNLSGGDRVPEAGMNSLRTLAARVVQEAI